MSYAVAGKTALVTGANRGIGEAIVDALVAAGAKKVYAAARTPADLAPLLARHGSRVVPIRLDITEATQINAAVALTGDVELLVNNAGVVSSGGGAFTDPAWVSAGRQEMEVNFFGTLAVTQAYAPLLAANGGGAIVNLSSIAALVNFPILAVYSASKAATHSITQAARTMLKGQGTQVFGVYPGPVDTRMAEGLEMEKVTPKSAAESILAGLHAGVEDIFPDPISAGMGGAYQTNPKGLERQVATMMAA